MYFARPLAVLFCLTLLLTDHIVLTDLRAADHPHILVISIDDLNDWVGCLQGHPQAQTPNIDRLAQRGTLFTNAHCQAPICTPSRASLVSGLFPHSTGLYFLNPGLEASDVTRNRRTLVQHFSDSGYSTFGAGKFHHKNEAQYYQQYGGRMGGFGPLPDNKLSYPEGLKLWDWGPFPDDEQQMPDSQVADWVISRLKQSHHQPFFLVAGFWRPHVPLYAPPRWFESFPIDRIQLPQVMARDRDDLPPYAVDLTSGLPAPRHAWFVRHQAWHAAVQAYLASVAFVDHCVGRVLTALDASPYADNTLIVLFSDHGWHLGEKERWAKRSLWHDSTHVPLIIAGNGLPSQQASTQPVGLIDIFPTLIDLSGVKPVTDLDGRSLRSLIQSPARKWTTPALTTLGPGNHSLHSEHWHYIRYADGSEELYDHRTDPHEWTNLATLPASLNQLMSFRKHVPRSNHPPVLSDWQNWEIQAWQTAEQNATRRNRSRKQNK